MRLANIWNETVFCWLKWFFTGILIFTCACSSNNNNNISSHETGDILFSVAWMDSERNHTTYRAAALECSADTVSKVSAIVYDAAGMVLGKGGPWDCTDRRGWIKGIAAGQERRLVLLAHDPDRNVYLRGQMDGIVVVANKENSIGELLATVFVPQSKSVNVTPDQVAFFWTPVQDAHQYHLQIATDTEFNTIVNETLCSNQPHILTTALDQGKFFWRIMAIDSDGMQSAWSQTKELNSEAVFYRLTVGTNSFGTVTTADTFIKCGESCVSDYIAGTHVSLIAVASDDAVFDSWSMPECGTDNPCEIIAGSDIEITAAFKTHWYKDNDSDGYSDGTFVLETARPDDNHYLKAELTAITGDCRDDDLSVNPDEIELLNDGIDQNCDLSDTVGSCEELVFYGDYTIIGPAEFDQLRGYTHITGSLIIDGTTLTTLKGLECLTRVDGSLVVSNNEGLEDLKGLRNVSHVGGDFHILNNDALAGFGGRFNLAHVGQSLKIIGNLTLVDMGVLGQAADIGEDLVIQYNESLKNLDAAQIIVSVANSIIIDNNSALVSLSGLSRFFDNQKTVNGSLTISRNNQLTGLNGLESLETIGASLTIRYNMLLPDIQHLSNLASIGENLNVSNNQKLSDLHGLNQLHTVKSIIVRDNGSLQNLFGASSLETLSGDITIQNNSSLRTMDNYASLTAIGGNIYINGNGVLSSLVGLGGIASIGGHLSIQANPELYSLDGLNGLRMVGGAIEITENNSLGHIDALTNLTQVSRNLEISLNQSLSNIDGIQNVSTIGGALIINGNDRVTEIVLNNLLSLGDAVAIKDNPRLTTINIAAVNHIGEIDINFSIDSNALLESIHMNALTSSTADFLFTNNPSLTQLDFPNLRTIEGYILINSNEALASLAGFPALTTVELGVSINNNSSLCQSLVNSFILRFPSNGSTNTGNAQC